MKRLDLHLLLSFIKYFLMAITVFFILFVSISLFDELSFFIRFNARLTDAALLILARSPLLVVTAIPIAALLAVTAAVTIQSRNGEITALRASGISLLRIARPFILGCLVAASIHFALQETVLPSAQALASEIETVRIRKKPATTLVRENNVWFRYKANMIHADRIKPDDKTMLGVMVYEWDGGRINRTTKAARAEWTGREWMLKDTHTWRFPEGRATEESTSPELPYPVSIPPDELSVIKLEPQYASMGTLDRRMETLKIQGADITALEVEFWKKTAVPFASLLMPLLAIPFAIRSTHRTGLWGAVAVGISAGFAFIAASMLLASLGKLGTLPPVLAAWAGNALFIPVSLWLMRRAERAG